MQFYNTWGACYTLQALPCDQHPSHNHRPDFKSACEVLRRAKRAENSAGRGRGNKRSCAAEYAAAADAPCEAKPLAPKEEDAAAGQELDSHNIQEKCLAVSPPPSLPPPHILFSSIRSLLFSAALSLLIVAVFEFRTQFERSPSPPIPSRFSAAALNLICTLWQASTATAPL